MDVYFYKKNASRHLAYLAIRIAESMAMRLGRRTGLGHTESTSLETTLVWRRCRGGRLSHTVRMEVGRMRTSLTTKILIAAALCLVVRALVAQAPAGGPTIDTDARGYKILVPIPAFVDPKNRNKLQDLKNELRLMVTAPSAPLNDVARRAKLDQYYLQYQFPIMTTEDGLKTVAAERALFLRDHVAAAKDPAMHSYLINLAFNTMKQVVQDNGFHPASRYNAMLLISQLNDQEANTLGASQTLPEPIRKCLQLIPQ